MINRTSSITEKYWEIASPTPASSTEEIFSNLLENRGIKDPDHFFNPGEMSDPRLMKGLVQAIEKIGLAINSNAKILIVGDYDVDGVMGTSILFWTLQAIKQKTSKGSDKNTINYYIPHRLNDGYGINKKIIDNAEKNCVKLIITVDNGISATEVIKYAQQKGIQVVVIDHHLPDETIPECTIVNPKQPECDYPFKELCAAGLVLRIAEALGCRYSIPRERIYETFSVFAGMATVADVVPLIDENRRLVQDSLRNIVNISHPGLERLLYLLNIPKEKLRSETYGFYLGPLINAAGRLPNRYEIQFKNSTNIAIDLMMGRLSAAQMLIDLNRERQQIVRLATKELSEELEKQEDDKLIILESDKWEEGIVGLIASWAMQATGKPVLAFTKTKGTYKGSGRSPGDIHLKELLDKCKKFTQRHGGHKHAAGLTVSERRFKLFKERAKSLVQEELKGKDIKPVVKIDQALSEVAISEEILDLSEKFEPCGQQNPRPSFALNDVQFKDTECVGIANSHLKGRIYLPSRNRHFPYIGFHLGPHVKKIKTDTAYQIAFTLTRSMEDDALQIQLEDAKYVG